MRKQMQRADEPRAADLVACAMGCVCALLVLLTWLTWTPAAAAQSCHAPALRADEPHESTVVRTTGSLVFAGYDNARGRGAYQGLVAALALGHAGFFGEVALPVYRLVRNGQTRLGPGDLAVDLRYALVSSERSGLSLGLELAATLPTGSAADELGMGHVMLMPGVFAALSLDRLFVLAQLAYGRALGSGSHVHGAHAAHAAHAVPVPGPVVNPMNLSEIEHALGVSYAVLDHVHALARWLGALPIAPHAGEARQSVALGVQGRAQRWELGGELHLPLVSAPFSYKAVVTAALLF